MSAIGRYNVADEMVPASLVRDSQTYKELSDRNIMHSIQARSSDDDPFNNAVDESEEAKRLHFHMQPNGFMDTDHERQEHLEKNTGDDCAFLAPTAETFDELQHHTETRPTFTHEGYIHDFLRQPVDGIVLKPDRTCSRSDFYRL